MSTFFNPRLFKSWDYLNVAVENVIPILQAKFYHIPPLERRFQTFGGIDIKFQFPTTEAILCDAQL